MAMDKEDLFSVVLVVSLTYAIYFGVFVIPNLDGACPVEDKPCLVSPASVLYTICSEVLYYLEDQFDGNEGGEQTENRLA